MPDTFQGLGVLADARFIAEQARHVTIDERAIERVAADFVQREVPVPSWNAELHFTDGTPRTANYLLLLDGLNFSFWGEPRWGIHYRDQALRGYWALAAALKRAIEEGIPVDDAHWMAASDETAWRHVLRGTGEIPLIDRRVAHANELGRGLVARYDGQFVRAIAEANQSAVALARLVVRDFPGFQDVAPYHGREVKLYKRARILPADLWGAFGGASWGRFDDIGELTAFADYKVPQVLEKLGILAYAPALRAKLLDRVELASQSDEEVEIRGATIWATELLREAMARRGQAIRAIELDWILWELGLHVTAADLPYHLTRTTAY